MPGFKNTSIQVVRIDDPSSYALITTPIDLECFKYLIVPAPAKPPVPADVVRIEVLPVVTIVPVPTAEQDIGLDPVVPCQVFSFHLNEQSISQNKAPAAVAEPSSSLAPVLKEFSFRLCSMLIKANKLIGVLIPLFYLRLRNRIEQGGASVGN